MVLKTRRIHLDRFLEVERDLAESKIKKEERKKDRDIREVMYATGYRDAMETTLNEIARQRIVGSLED